MRPVTPRRQSLVVGLVEGGQHRPDLHRGGVAPGLLRARAHLGHAAGQGLVGDEGVEDHPVDHTTGPAHRLEAEARGHHGDVGVDAAPERQQRVRPGRAVVPEHGLAPPEPPVQPDGVLHLRHRDRRDAHDAEERRDPPADAQGEAAARQLVHRVRPCRRHQRVARRRVGHTGRDADLLGHRGGGAAQGRRLLHVEPLRQEHRSEPDALGVPHLVEQHARIGHVPGQPVAARARPSVQGSPCRAV